MLLSYLLTNTAQIFADVRPYWSPDAVRRVTGQALEGRAAGGVIHLINSGSASLDASGQMERDRQPAMKPFWEIEEGEVSRELEATTWYPAVTGYFRGGGFSSNFLSKGGMPVTMCRINLVAGVGPVLQLAQGWTVDLPSEVHRALDLRTDPTWPTHWFVPEVTGEGPFRDVYSVMANWGANHGAISYGHIGADLISLAALLRIPVSMHNVPKDQVFRPSAWTRSARPIWRVRISARAPTLARDSPSALLEEVAGLSRRGPSAARAGRVQRRRQDARCAAARRHDRLDAGSPRWPIDRNCLRHACRPCGGERRLHRLGRGV